MHVPPPRRRMRAVRLAEDLTVSRLCCGAMNFGDRNSDAEATSVVHACLDSGVTFFDTANVYAPDRAHRVTVLPVASGFRVSVIGWRRGKLTEIGAVARCVAQAQRAQRGGDSRRGAAGVRGAAQRGAGDQAPVTSLLPARAAARGGAREACGGVLRRIVGSPPLRLH